MKKLNFIIFSAMLILSAACGEDEENPVDEPKEPTKTDLLTGKDWTVVSLEVDPPVVVEDKEYSDVWEWVPECLKDNILNFSPDGTYVQDEGGAKCNDQTPQEKNGTWSFSEDETKVTTVLEDETRVFTILKIEDETLEVSFAGEELFPDKTITVGLVK